MQQIWVSPEQSRGIGSPPSSAAHAVFEAEDTNRTVLIFTQRAVAPFPAFSTAQVHAAPCGNTVYKRVCLGALSELDSKLCSEPGNSGRLQPLERVLLHATLQV